MNECEHEHHEHIHVELPCWRFSFWDVPGVGLWVASSMAGGLSAGLNRLATECQAMANYRRATWQEEEAQIARYRAVAEHEAHQRHLAETVMGFLRGEPTAEEGDV